MRHKKSGRQFGRDTSSRRAMLRNLAANLITHERIETTEAKAKELRRVAERLLTKAIRLGELAYTVNEKQSEADKARRLHAKRLVMSYIPRFGVRMEKGGVPKRVDLVEKVFLDLAKRFQGRPGGYTRIVKFGPRRGDNASMSIIEFVGDLEAPAAEPKGEAKASKSKSKTKKATTAEPAKGAKVE
jgi:large subunit ribosomal protein L17